MKSRLMMWPLMMIESAIGAWFSRTAMEGRVVRRPLYIQIGGMSTICRRSRW